MLCTDLILPVMIVLIGITLMLGFPAENRHENCTNINLEPIIIKMNNVIAKLYESEKELEMFYPWFRQLSSPKSKESSRLRTWNCKKLEGRVLGLGRDIRKISKELKFLISQGTSSNFKEHLVENSRVKLLKEILAEINNVEIFSTKQRNKKRKKSLTRRMPKEVASGNLSIIKSQTELKIEERRLLETLKMILVDWSKNFNIPGIPAGGVCKVCRSNTSYERHSKRRLKFL